MFRRLSIFCVAGLLAACTTATTPRSASTIARREPANLSVLKAELVQYHESGDYERAVAGVARDARTWIERRIGQRKEGEKLAIVLDIDETALSNWASMQANDFGYIPDRWKAWVNKAEATAIAPVREVYRVARSGDVAVFFITGRSEDQRRGTELNLFREGYDDFAQLIMRPSDAEKRSAAAFKTEVRQKLTERGFTLIANIGDQESDLTGGFAEKTFKLPNPFYRTD
jgi:predicted secreted acid phosphatase